MGGLKNVDVVAPVLDEARKGHGKGGSFKTLSAAAAAAAAAAVELDLVNVDPPTRIQSANSAGPAISRGSGVSQRLGKDSEATGKESMMKEMCGQTQALESLFAKNTSVASVCKGVGVHEGLAAMDLDNAVVEDLDNAVVEDLDNAVVEDVECVRVEGGDGGLGHASGDGRVQGLKGAMESDTPMDLDQLRIRRKTPVTASAAAAAAASAGAGASTPSAGGAGATTPVAGGRGGASTPPQSFFALPSASASTPALLPKNPTNTPCTAFRQALMGAGGEEEITRGGSGMKHQQGQKLLHMVTAAFAASGSLTEVMMTPVTSKAGGRSEAESEEGMDGLPSHYPVNVGVSCDQPSRSCWGTVKVHCSPHGTASKQKQQQGGAVGQGQGQETGGPEKPATDVR